MKSTIVDIVLGVAFAGAAVAPAAAAGPTQRVDGCDNADLCHGVI